MVNLFTLLLLLFTLYTLFTLSAKAKMRLVKGLIEQGDVKTHKQSLDTCM